MAKKKDNIANISKLGQIILDFMKDNGNVVSPMFVATKLNIRPVKIAQEMKELQRQGEIELTKVTPSMCYRIKAEEDRDV